MNIQSLACALMSAVIIVALCSIMMVMEVSADRVNGEIDISEPTEVTVMETIVDTTVETKPRVEIPDEFRVIEKVEVKDDIDVIKETLHANKEEPTEVPETIVEVNPVRYYDIPLNKDVQDHIFALAEEYGIDHNIIIAMIHKESNFIIDNMGDGGNSYGLMQIQPRWHQARMERLGVTDLLDPYQNITVGVDYLAECIRLGGGSLEWGLMAYNGGPSYARELWANGEISYYAQTVINWARAYASY